MLYRTLLSLSLLFVSLTAAAKDLKTVTFKVEQMHCVNCEAKVKREVPYLKGVKKMKTLLESKTVVITFDAEKTSITELQRGFDKFGYKAEVLQSEQPTEKKKS